MKKSDTNIICTLAFIALVAVGVSTLVGALLDGSMLYNIFETVKNVCVIIVIGFTAYKFTEGKEKWVTILYWVAVAVFVVGIVLVWF